MSFSAKSGFAQQNFGRSPKSVCADFAACGKVLELVLIGLGTRLFSKFCRKIFLFSQSGASLAFNAGFYATKS